MIQRILFLIFLFLLSCADEGPAPTTSTRTLYFPEIGSIWERATPASLGWDETKMIELDAFLTATNTRALIVLKDGKIVIEKYLGKQLVNTTADFLPTSNWYWASAGKTLTAGLVGIAQSQGRIDLNAKTSDYLDEGWSSLTDSQESKITVRHHLTMTTGLDDEVANSDCTDPGCLVYKADAGTRWAYHNAPFTILDDVIFKATDKTLNDFAKQELFDKIGMDGQYIKTGDNNVFYSTARSMARYGLLLMNRGKWDQTQIIPESYFNLMTTSSQNLNPAYGFLTWLNGKSTFMIPGSQASLNGYIAPNAPNDMIAAMGKNGQLINLSTVRGLVVVRMGDAPDTSQVPYAFQNDLWEKLNAIIIN